MSITVNRKDLISVLAAAERVTPSRSTKEILKLVRVTVSGGVLTVTATDSEITLTQTIEGVDGELYVLVSPSKFRAAIADAPEDEIELRGDTSRLHIKAGGKIALPIENAKDFPPCAPLDIETRWSVDGSELHRVAGIVAECCDVESTRYALGGVLFDANGTLVATDSRALSVMPLRCEVLSAMPAGSVVPVKAIKALSAFQDRGVHVAGDQKHVVFAADGVTLTTQLIQGRFPQWEKVVPTKFTFTVSVSAPLLASLLKRAMHFTSEESRAVDLIFADGELTVDRSGGSESLGEFVSSIPIDYDSERVTASFDPRYLLRGLKTDASVDLRVIDADSAMLITDGTLTTIVMPLSRDR